MAINYEKKSLNGNIKKKHFYQSHAQSDLETHQDKMFRIGVNIVWSQWLAGIGVAILLLHLGVMGGWSSPTLARLKAADSPILVTEKQESWIASLVNFGRFFGGILGAITINCLGTKKSILATLVPITLGWLMLVLADAVEWLYISRLFSGLGLGMAFSTFPLYIGEVSMPEIRGALISFATMGSPIGQVLASVCGAYMTMKAAACIYLGLAFALVFLFLWLPESPHYLMRIGNHEAARSSIEWYRGGKNVDDEFQAVEQFVASDAGKSFLKKLQDFKKPSLKKATIQIITLYVFMQISGVNIVMFYMEKILVKAEFKLMNASEIVIVANVACAISSAISIFLIDRCGRKFLLTVSSAGTASAMISLTTYFFLAESGVDVTYVRWLPGVSLIIFMAFYFVGLMPVPSAILSETFPADSKYIAAGIAILTGAVMSFVSAKTYQPMIDMMGEAYVFLLYALCSLIIIPYSLFVLPETKGKSLQQIQEEMMNK